VSYRPASLCSLATQFQTRFLESIPRPIAGLKFSALCTSILLVVERDTRCTSILLAAEIKIKTKAQTFRYQSLLLEQNQNVLIWSAYYRNKSRTFQFVPKSFKIEWEHFGVFLNLKTKPERNRVYFLSDRNVSIHLCFRGIQTELLYFQKTISERTQNVSNCARIF
jgi:hypothetical protein